MNEPPDERDEAEGVRARYARRGVADPRYSLTQPAALAALHEREKAIVRLLVGAGLSDFAALSLLEVGSGSGGNLLGLLRLGFSPERLTGIELLEDRHAAARARLPAGVTLIRGDATTVPIAPESLDIVLQATVFSSLLDDAYQVRLARAMWQAVSTGSMLASGRAPWLPLPVTVMSKKAPPAAVGPGRMPYSPIGMPGRLCIP